MNLKLYISISNAIVLLMKPLVEVVIHDIKSETIVYIEGDLSKRKIGDPSLLETLYNDLDKTVYSKLNFDGRLIKSISIPLEDRWLMCINCDVSIFTQMQGISQQLLKTTNESQPQSLFKNDWREKLHISIHSFLKRKSWTFENLSGIQKKELVKHLFDNGAFFEKNAADYIATALNMGRATIFKFLKEWR